MSVSDWLERGDVLAVTGCLARESRDGDVWTITGCLARERIGMEMSFTCEGAEGWGVLHVCSSNGKREQMSPSLLWDISHVSVR